MSESTGARLRVILLDDHPVMRRGLELLLKLEYSIDVVGSFRSSAELFAGHKHVRADVIVTDYALAKGDVDGQRLIRSLKQHIPHARILVMSTHCNAGTVAMAMRAGADGFIGKNQSLPELVLAIQAIAAGRVYPSGEQVQAIGSTEPSGVEAADELLGFSRLSPREREVLRCVLDGMSISEIAAKFSRQVTTISAQKNSAFRKLGIRTNNELFKIWHQLDR
ncbi:response regulator transcription factor [Dyella choica]|uniref:Response regulator transcription factor n=1 Tax=Dyella choica TaxID=1927959 RepID=A0A3S0PIV4_9GAMM|nr:response regulator transcription factor [Dyella choica]RUL76070.1 response regulator transcription factor [Dyella choica]